jgi:phosphate transport system protein
MVTLDPELQALKENLLEMLELTKRQLAKCLNAVEEGDMKSAKDVIEKEKRLNSLEVDIDKDCENILALHNPVASDLRFVLAALKITSNLERIGDNSKSIAKYITKNITKTNRQILGQFNAAKMVNVTLSMLDEVGIALKQQDTELAKRIAFRDEELDDETRNALKIATRLIREDPENPDLVLRTYTVIRRLERIGDYIKNIAEEVIFHNEGKIVKHQKP